jgi:MFS family permease
MLDRPAIAPPDGSTSDALRRHLPLYVGEFFILAANGIVFTAIAARALAAGLDAGAIGLAGSAFYAGLFTTYLAGPLLLRLAGLRVMAAAAAPLAAAGVALLLVADPLAWLLGRYAMGLGIALVYVTMENWLSLSVGPRRRGSVLGVYMAVFLGSYAIGQAVLLVLPAASDAALLVAGACLVVGGVAMLVPTAAPRPRFSPRGEPALACILRHALPAIAAALASGMVSGAFFALGPVYALTIGLPERLVPWLLIAVVAGASLAQLGLGLAADRIDRRTIMLVTCVVSTLASIALAVAGVASLLVYALAVAWGATALTGYAVAAAIAYNAPHGRPPMQVARLLQTMNGAGGIAGPALASLVDGFAPGRGGFVLSIGVFAVLMLLVLARSPRSAPRIDP